MVKSELGFLMIGIILTETPAISAKNFQNLPEHTSPAPLSLSPPPMCYKGQPFVYLGEIPHFLSSPYANSLACHP